VKDIEHSHAKDLDDGGSRKERAEESKYIDLLKKNYDVILEKYETYRSRNE